MINTTLLTPYQQKAIDILTQYKDQYSWIDAAIQNVILQSDADEDPDHIITLADAVDSFIWNNTPEGKGYWSNVWDSWRTSSNQRRKLLLPPSPTRV